MRASSGSRKGTAGGPGFAEPSNNEFYGRDGQTSLFEASLAGRQHMPTPPAQGINDTISRLPGLR